VAGDVLDRSSAELAGVPGDLADAAASAILGSLRPEERANLVRRPTQNAEAHDSYLRALHAADSWSQQGPQVAIEYLDRAIALDSSFAPAYAAKGEALALLADAYLVGHDAYTQARAAAAHAVQLDSTLALGYAVLSISTMALDYDIPASAELARRAIRLDPRVGMGHIMLGTDLLIQGRNGEALVEIRRGWDVDTLDAVGTAIYAWTLYLTHQLDSMAVVLPRASALAPEDMRAYRGLLDYGRGDYSAAVQRLSWSYYGGWLAGEYVHALVRLGRRDEARAAVDSMIAARTHGYYNPYAIGRGYVALGDLDSAFTWLERGYQERTQWMVFMFFDPMFAPFKSDPRYVAIISRMRS
jgi:tetratricopeptide (TPR) repeat protein